MFDALIAAYFPGRRVRNVFFETQSALVSRMDTRRHASRIRPGAKNGSHGSSRFKPSRCVEGSTHSAELYRLEYRADGKIVTVVPHWDPPVGNVTYFMSLR